MRRASSREQFCGRDGARTRDLYHVEVALYQLSYAPLLNSQHSARVRQAKE